MGKVREKVKIFLESVTKTVLYVTCTPLNSNVESLTLPLIWLILDIFVWNNDLLYRESFITKIEEIFQLGLRFS